MGWGVQDASARENLEEILLFLQLAIKVFFLARRTEAAAALDEPMQTTLPEAVLPFFTHLLSLLLLHFHCSGAVSVSESASHRRGTGRRLTRWHALALCRVQSKHRQGREAYILEFPLRLHCKKLHLPFPPLLHRCDRLHPHPLFWNFMHCLLQESPNFHSTLVTCKEGEIGKGCSLLYFFPSRASLPILSSSFFFSFSFCFSPGTKVVTKRCNNAHYFPLEGLFPSNLRAVRDAKKIK